MSSTKTSTDPRPELNPIKKSVLPTIGRTGSGGAARMLGIIPWPIKICLDLFISCQEVSNKLMVLITLIDTRSEAGTIGILIFDNARADRLEATSEIRNDNGR